ncbi:Zn-ribbon domain-containing OB-fold protein [Streptacidiphilus sp. EB129]|jgi:uncharacterized OB-fold protein|uniref:Zn-ribbon domain-containing OB-fold protein n=1 Tax=Streptacidiphilus sp. EB129 TaxID=3156262 RepID=UPI0035137486
MPIDHLIDASPVDASLIDASALDPVEVYRDGLARGELRYRRCRWCASRSAQVGLLCVTCGGTDFRWERSSGQGRIYRMALPSAAAPAECSAVVELDEGFRMNARLAPAPAHQLWPGAPVRLEVAGGDGELRPRFRPTAA